MQRDRLAGRERQTWTETDVARDRESEIVMDMIYGEH